MDEHTDEFNIQWRCSCKLWLTLTEEMSENMCRRCESPQVSLARSNHRKYVNSSIHHNGQCHNYICCLLVTALIFRSPWVTARKITINAHRHNSLTRNNIRQESQYHWPAAPSLHKQYLLMQCSFLESNEWQTEKACSLTYEDICRYMHLLHNKTPITMYHYMNVNPIFIVQNTGLSWLTVFNCIHIRAVNITR